MPDYVIDAGVHRLAHTDQFCDWLRAQLIKPEDTTRVEITGRTMRVYQFDTDEEGRKYVRPGANGGSVAAMREPFDVLLADLPAWLEEARVEPQAACRRRALDIVQRERERQLVLKRQGRFKYTPSDDGVDDTERLAMLCEEVGEVARNTLRRVSLVTDGDDTDEALRKELSQVAAIAVAWIERLI